MDHADNNNFSVDIVGIPHLKYIPHYKFPSLQFLRGLSSTRPTFKQGFTTATAVPYPQPHLHLDAI